MGKRILGQSKRSYSKKMSKTSRPNIRIVKGKSSKKETYNYYQETEPTTLFDILFGLGVIGTPALFVILLFM